MAELAVPSTFTPAANGYFATVFFTNDIDDFQWNAFVVSADKLDGDAWYSPVALLPTPFKG
jgi:hypothetical protein